MGVDPVIRSEYLTQRHLARRAIRALTLLPPPPCSTWQDKDRAQEWVRVCVGRLPGREYARPHNPIDAQTRLTLFCQFPQWATRLYLLREKRRQAAMRERITAIVSHLGPSIVAQNIAAQEARSAA